MTDFFAAFGVPFYLIPRHNHHTPMQVHFYRLLSSTTETGLVKIPVGEDSNR